MTLLNLYSNYRRTHIKIIKNQKEIAHILIVTLIVLLIAVITFAAYRIGAQNKKSAEKIDSQTVDTKKNNSPQKANEIRTKTYTFYKTNAKIDIPESWKATITGENDTNDDKVNDSYSGKILADNGWEITYSGLLNGGFGGGPGCNEDGQFPDGPECPTFTVLDQKESGTVLISSYDSNQPNFRCFKIGNNSPPLEHTINQTFTGTMWDCFSTLQVNSAEYSVNEKANQPSLIKFSITIPKTATSKNRADYIKDTDYKSMLSALKTLRIE